MDQETEPYAKIQRLDRWRYRVVVYGGGNAFLGNWRVWGRAHAERVARRQLRKRVRQQQEWGAWRADERIVRL